VFINKPSFWGSIVLATLSFGSCSRLSHSPSELLFYRADGGSTPHEVTAPRKVYRYSIVPGGVYSGEELERVRRVDPVVTAHYSDFGSQVTVDKLDSDMFVYVSYRKANRVYWSAQKHKVPKGETILTDGNKHMARTRCGNRLSLTPQKPIALVEPPELNRAEDPPLMASLPSPPLFLPAGAATPNLVPGATGAAPGTGPAPISSVTPGPSGSEVPVGGPVAVVPPSGAPIVGPVLPVAPTTPVVPVCPPAPAAQIDKSGLLPRAVDPAGTCPVTPVTPVATPEPSEFGLLLMAGLGAGLMWRKRRSA
jgi:hypothetical protein